MVRHPFSRLVSAYWDKLIYENESSLYQGVKQSIRKLVRPGASEKEISRIPITFQQFVQAVLNPRWKHKGDRHWRSAVQLCSPCAIQYDYIIDVENIALQIEPMLLQLSDGDRHMYEKLSSMVKPANRHSELKTNPKQSSIVLRDFKNLTSTQITGLIDRFSLDLQLFGYTFDTNTYEVDLKRDLA